MVFSIFDHTVRRKLELLRDAERRVCIVSKTTGSPRSGLHDLRHFVLVDVLKNRLRLDGIQVDHLIAGTPSALESDFRALDIALPDGWVRPLVLRRRRLDELLPGPAAREMVTCAVAPPLAFDSAMAPPLTPPGAQDRLLVVINASPPRPYALETDSGRPWLPEPDDREPVERTVSDLVDLEMVRSAGVGPRQFRFHCLATHYRRPVSFSLRALRRSALAHQHLTESFSRLQGVRSEPESDRAISMGERFREAFADDVNAARALSIVAATLREKAIPANEKLGLLSKMNAVLGLGFVEREVLGLPSQDLRRPTSAVTSRAQPPAMHGSVELHAGAA
ncbi:MAG TPA: hypothetical protein VHC69_29865 [Polyangiaceae bacterium]|nr:hypothetical protein [Polyangiaceae bacterium]